MIIDCFMFFNELEILEIRLNALAPFVDQFVLVESRVNHRGNPKPLVFEQHKQRFQQFNIKHIIMDGLPEDFTGTTDEILAYHLNFLATGLTDVGPDDIILLADVDEIPDLTHYTGGQGVFVQQAYYYYLNYREDRTVHWRGTIALKMNSLARGPIAMWRASRRKDKVIAPFPFHGGWHFSSIGTPEQMLEKFDSYSHQETDYPEKRQQILENRLNLRDPYYQVWRTHASMRNFHKEMPTGPQWLLDNKDKFAHLFL